VSPRPRIALLLGVVSLGAFVVGAWPSEDEPASPPPTLPFDASALAKEVPDAAPPPVLAAPVFTDGYCAKGGSFTTALVFEKVKEPLDGGITWNVRSIVARAGDPQKPPPFLSPRDRVEPWVEQALLARTALFRRHSEEHLAALRRAFALAPTEPGIGLELAMETLEEPDLDEAIAGLTAASAAFPFAELMRRRARLELARDLQRTYQRETRNGVTLLWPPESVTPYQGKLILWELDRSLDRAAALTGTPRRGPLTAVVYPSRSELLAVTCAPTWAGGSYDGILRLVARPGPEGVDVRAAQHETLHAQLEGRLIPTWFDEGLAQSFSAEKPRLKEWDLMVRNRTWIPFASLQQGFSAFEGSADASLAYAQSFAMVELMRECGGDAAIAQAVLSFGRLHETPSVLGEACRRPEVTGEELLGFLSRKLARRDGN